MEPAKTTSTTMSTTCKIGGMDIEINDTPSEVKTLIPLYRKEDRKNLSDDKRNELFDRATKTAHIRGRHILLCVVISFHWFYSIIWWNTSLIKVTSTDLIITCTDSKTTCTDFKTIPPILWP